MIFMAAKSHKNPAAIAILTAPMGAQNISGCRRRVFCAFLRPNGIGGFGHV